MLKLRGGRSETVALLSVAVVLLMGLSSLSVVGAPAGVATPVASLQRASSGLHAETQTQPTLMAQAIASLAAGQGPAAGGPMSCTVTGGGETCSAETPREAPASATPSVASPVLPQNASPTARYGAAMASYVAPGSSSYMNVMLFGGANSSGYVFNDTWIFTTVNDTWTNIIPFLHCNVSSCPSGRHDAAASFLQNNAFNNQTVLFGGCTVASPGWAESAPPCSGAAGAILNDTWVFTDPSPGWGKWNWTRLPTSVAPSPRFDAAIAFAPVYGSLILFGGCGPGGACPLGDTWQFNGSGWTNLSITGPAARYGAAMGLIKTSLGSVEDVLFGGCGTSRLGCVSGATSEALQDTWALSPSFVWTQLISASNCLTVVCPSPRYLADYASVAAQGALELYGGSGVGGVVLGNTVESAGGWWAFGSAGTWAATPTPLGTGCTPGCPAAWTGPSPVWPPLDRYDGMLVSADISGTLMFGGSAASGSSLGDTWVARESPYPQYSGLLWPPPAPSPGYGGSMVNDYADGYDVMFGGCSAECGNVSTWTYSPAFTDTAGLSTPWQSLWPSVNPTNSPPARINASMVYFNDTGNIETVILFGGLATNGTLLNDTWSFQAGAWTQVTFAVGGAQPSPRQSAAFAFNSSGAEENAVLFGGCGTTCPLGDTWTLSYAVGFSWKLQHPLSSPASRYGAALAYDAANNRMVLFGGCGLTCPLGDTWFFQETPTYNWTQCTTGTCSGASAPPARWGAAITYDVATKTLIMFGGCGATCPLGDTWAFGISSLVNKYWFAPLMGTSPPARFDAVLADQPPGNNPVLEGGVGANGRVLGGPGYVLFPPASPRLSWGWLTGSSLNEIPRAPAPMSRFGASLAFDPLDGYALLFGGCQFTRAADNCGPMAEASTTWLFENGSWIIGCTGCGPSARWDAALAYDTASREFVLFGGCTATDDVCSSASVLHDTWTYAAGTWSLITPPTSPGARGDASVAYDSVGQVMVLFGGIGCGGLCSDTWTFSAGLWTMWTGGGGPSARLGAAMAGNGALGVLLFGGLLASGTVSGQTWSFKSGWVLRATTGPTAVCDASMIELPNGTDLLMGGAGAGGVPSSATRLFLVSSWAGTGGTLPVELVRWGMSAAFDSAAGTNGFGLVFGGSLGDDPIIPPSAAGFAPGQGDTWQFLVNPVPAPGSPFYDLSLCP